MPDVACLQEIKTGDAKFPARRDRGRGLRRDLARPALASRRRDPRAGRAAGARSAAACPGDEGDAQARYLEAEVDGLRRRVGLPAERQSRSPARTSTTSSPGSSG